MCFCFSALNEPAPAVGKVDTAMEKMTISEPKVSQHRDREEKPLIVRKGEAGKK